MQDDRHPKAVKRLLGRLNNVGTLKDPIGLGTVANPPIEFSREADGLCPSAVCCRLRPVSRSAVWWCASKRLNSRAAEA